MNKQKLLHRLLMIFSFLVSLSMLQVHADEKHKWDHIAYPPIECPWDLDSTTPQVTCDKAGLRLDFSFSSLSSPPKRPNQYEMKVKLHIVGGEILQPTSVEGDDIPWVGFLGIGAGGTYSFTFDWQENKFQEAWLEVRFPGYIYWLELPYGFTRNPSDELCEVETLQEPEVAPAMKTLEKNAEIIRWEYVEYELGTPKKATRYILRQSNPLDAESELILYTNNTKDQNLFEPKSFISIQQPGDRTLDGRIWSVSLLEDRSSRSDKFEYYRNSTDKRGWATVKVKIKDFDKKVIVPTSLVNYGHGH